MIASSDQLRSDAMSSVVVPDHLEIILKKHSEATDSICHSLTNELDSGPVPELVYHYTDDRGLVGILSTGQLWLTDLFDLNDPSELRHGIGHALTLLESAAENGRPEVQLFCQNFRHVMSKDLELIAHHFVCCFSTRRDDLGQWRAYANDGRGYAIGFDTAILNSAFKKWEMTEQGSHGTFPILYDDKRMRRIHERLVDATIPAISAPRGMGLTGSCIAKFMKSLSLQLASSFIEMSIYFKNEAYQCEQEYRFLETFGIGHVPTLRFRSGKSALVRYREFDWRGMARQSIRKIVCGPATDQKHAVKRVHDCVREYLPGSEPRVWRSDIPYRSVKV